MTILLFTGAASTVERVKRRTGFLFHAGSAAPADLLAD
jgi:hypothetical protein